VLHVKDEALEKDTPANNDRNMAGLNPDKVAVVGFHEERFTTEIVIKLSDCIIQCIRFLLEGVPIDGSSRVLVRGKCNWLVYDSALGVCVLLKQNSANSVVGGV
jgi:hypothetical protein